MEVREDKSTCARNDTQEILTFNWKKIKKPLMERKRRERINRALCHLKILLLDNIRIHGGTQTAKLDKADVLEMTVNYLTQLRHGKNMVSIESDKFLFTNEYLRYSTVDKNFHKMSLQPEIMRQQSFSDDLKLDQDAYEHFSPELYITTLSDLRRQPVISVIDETNAEPVTSNTADSQSMSNPPSCHDGITCLSSDVTTTSGWGVNYNVDNGTNNHTTVWRPW